MGRGAHLCGGAELHDVLEARGVQVALGLLAEEVDAALVDAQREVGGPVSYTHLTLPTTPYV